MRLALATLFFVVTLAGPISVTSLSRVPPLSVRPLVACETIQRLFGGGTVDPKVIASACDPNIEWHDFNAAQPLTSPAAVENHLVKRFPAGARLIVERVAEGSASGGFTWHYEDANSGAVGLRGTTYVEIDPAKGLLTYVKEGCEPIAKPGRLTAQLLQAVTQGVEKTVEPATYTPCTPTDAPGVVSYLWQEAYPGGAETAEALRLFSPTIRYEDFNYESTFEGKDVVAAFLAEFDFPGIEFIPSRISEGNRGCCFTWRVTINGKEGPEGISFYEVDDDGRVCFIRDIPAPSIKPPPLLSLAALLRPKLRVFRPR
mmetsp:Transcript_15055/g.27802  ORF Transcript_15055/g.27802 Transcript_15055/m.27802 type:complete len:315 (+) Transcript_15055:127-1071(+)